MIDNPSAEAWVKEHLTRAEGRDTGAAWIRNPGGELGGLYEWWKKDFKGRKASAKVKGVQGQSGLALVFKLSDGRFLITSVKEMTIQDRSPYRGGYLPPNTIVPYLRNPDTGKGVAVHRLADPKNLGKLFPLLQGARLEGYTYVGPQYEKKASFSAILTEDQFDRISRTAKTQTIKDQGPGAAPAAARGEVNEATGMREVVAQAVQPDDFAGYKPDDYSRKSIAAVLKELQTTDPKLWLRLLSSTAAIMKFDNHPRLQELIQLNKQKDLSKAEWLVYEVIIEQLRAAGAEISAQELPDPDGSLLWDWTKPRGKSQTKPAPARSERGAGPGAGDLAAAQPRTDDELRDILGRIGALDPDEFRSLILSLTPEERSRMEVMVQRGKIQDKTETRDAAGNKAKFGTKPKEDEEASFPDEDEEPEARFSLTTSPNEYSPSNRSSSALGAGAADAVQRAAARKDAAAALARIRSLGEAGGYVDARADDVFLESATGQKLAARARGAGIQLAFTTGSPNISGVTIGDSIVLSTDNRSDQFIENTFEHELAHIEFTRRNPILMQLAKLVLPDSDLAKAIVGLYQRSLPNARILSGVDLVDEILATYIGGTANIDGVPLVRAFSDPAAALRLKNDYLNSSEDLAGMEWQNEDKRVLVTKRLPGDTDSELPYRVTEFWKKSGNAKGHGYAGNLSDVMEFLGEIDNRSDWKLVRGSALRLKNDYLQGTKESAPAALGPIQFSISSPEGAFGFQVLGEFWSGQPFGFPAKPGIQLQIPAGTIRNWMQKNARAEWNLLDSDRKLSNFLTDHPAVTASEMAAFLNSLNLIPKIEVYGMEGKVSEAKKEYDRMTHDWLDNLDPQERAELNSYINTANTEYLEGSKPQDIANAKRMRELKQQMATEKTDGYGPRATSAYSNVSALDTNSPMPEWTRTRSGKNVQRLDVVLPYKTPKGGLPGYEGAFAAARPNAKETKEANILWSPDGLHENLPNTLGWAMIQYKTGPNGEKIAVVAEAQSRWGQKMREYNQETEAHAKEMSSEEAAQWRKERKATPEISEHPLLRDYNRLILKSAIDQAIKEGATHIMVSDAETAMMTEGHDKVARRSGSYASQEEALMWIADNEDPGKPAQKSNGKWEVIEITQEPGMRLNYDKILPKIAEELTGSPGERVSLGDHKNAFDTNGRTVRANGEPVGPDDELRRDDRFVPNPRSNLVFKNPDGSPKTDVSGMLYPLAEVQKRREERGPFTIAAPKFSADQDARYLELAKDPEKNRAELERMVNAAAKAAGYTVGPVYHGTDRKFTVFDTRRNGEMTSGFADTPGSYFTPKQEYAAGVSRWASFKSKQTPRVVSAYLKITNPIDNSIVRSEQLSRSDIEARGFDGKVFTREDESAPLEYTAFYPEQIKLADPVTYDANGQVIPLSQRFNEQSPDIRFAAVQAGDIRYSLPDTSEQARFRQSVKEAELSRGAAASAAEAAAKQSFENWLSTFKAPAEAVAKAAGSSSAKLAEIRVQAAFAAPKGERLTEAEREQKRIAKRTLSQSFLRILSRLEKEVKAATDAAGDTLLSFDEAKKDAAKPSEQQRLSATERNRIYTRAYEHVSKIWAAIAAFRNTFDNRRHAIADQLIELQKERKDLKTEQGLRKAIQEQVVELFDEGLALGEAGAKRRAIYKQARLGSSTGSHVLAFLGSQLDDIRAAAERNLADRQAAADAQMARTGQPRQTLELSESDWMAGVMEVAAYLGRQINPDDESRPEQVLGANEQRVQEVVRAWLGDQALQTMVQEVRDALTQAQLQPIGGLLPKAAAAKFEELRQAYVQALQESDGDLAKLREAKRKLLRIANVTSTQNLDLLLKVVARKESRLEAEMAALPTANQIISELTNNSSPFARLSREIADAEAVGVVHQLMGTDRETGELVLNALPGLGTSGNFLIQILTELKQAGNLPDKLTAKQWKELFLSNPSIPPYIIESLDWPSDSTVLDSAQTDNKDNLIRVVMTAEKAALPVRVSLRPENSQAAEQQIRRYITVARQYVIGAGLEGPQAGQPGPASRAYDPRIARALSLEVIPKLETIIGQAESEGRINEQGRLESSLNPSSMSPKSGTTRFGVANRFALGLQALLSRLTKRGGWFAIASIDSKGLPPYLRNFLFSAATAHAGLQSQIESLVADRGPRLDAALNDALNEQEIRNRDLEVYEREVFNPIAASYQHADTGRRLVAGDRIGNGRTVTKEDIRLLELTHELWNRAGDIMVRNGLGIQVTTPEGHPAHRPMWDLGPKMVPRSAFRMQNLADEFKNLRDPVNQTFDLVGQMELLARNPDLIDAYAAGAGHNEYKHNYAGLRQAIFRVWSRVLAGGNAAENQPLGSNGLHPLADLANRVAAEFNQDQLQVLGEAEGPVRQLAPEAALRTLQADIRDIFLKVAGEEGRLPGDLKTLLDADGNLKLDATRSMSFNTLALIVGGTTELVSPRGNLIAPPGWYDYSAFSHEAVKRMNRIAEWPFLLRALETMATLQKAVETELKTLEESLTQQPLRGPDRGKPPTLLGPQRSKDAAAGLQWMTYGQLKALSVSLQTMVQDLQQRLISAKERPAGVPKFATVGEVGGRTAKRWYQASITSVLATMSVYALQAVGGWAKLTAQIARTSPNRLTGAITAWPKSAGFILKGLKRSVIYNELVNQIASTPGLRDALGITSVTAFDRKQLTTVIMPAMLKFMEEQVHLMDEMVAAGIITRESTFEAAAGILEFWGSGGEPGLRPLLESPGRIKSAALTGGMSAVAVANLVNALFRRGLAVADNANNIAGAMWAQTILDTLHRKLLLAYNAGMPAEQVGLQSLLSSEYPAESIKHLQDFLGESQLNLVGVYRRLQQKLDAANPEEQAKIRQALPFSDEEIHRAWLAGASITNKSTLWNRPSSAGRRDFLASALGLFKNYALSEFLDIVGSATSKMSNQGWLRAMPMMFAGLAGISLTYAIGGLGLNDFDKWWKRFVLRTTSNRNTLSDIVGGRVLDPKEQQAILVDGIARVGGHFGWLWYLATGRSKGERQGFELNRSIYGLNLLQDLTMNGLQAAKQFSLSAITDPNKTLLEKAEAAWLPVKDPIYNTLGRYVAPFTWFKNWLPGTEGKAALQGYRATMLSSSLRSGVNIKETSNFVGKNYDAATPYYSGAAAEAAAGNIEKALALRAEGRKQLTKLYGQREENGRIVGLSEQELDQRDAQRIQSMLPVVGEKKPDSATRSLIESTLTPRELAEVQQVEANFAAFSQAATGKTVSPISTRGAASGGVGGSSIAGISGGSSGAAAGSSLSGRSRLSGGSSLGRSRLSGGRLSGSRLSSGRRISSGRSAMKPKVMGRLRVRSSRLGGRRLRL